MNRFTTTIALVLGLIAVEPAMACSCAVSGVSFEEQVAEAFATADYVILGEVTKVESIVATDELPDGQKGRYDAQLAHIKVIESWKGGKKAGDDFLTRTITTCCMCGLSVEVGQRWLVYAYGKEPVSLSTCSRTARADRSSRDIPVLERILRGRPPLPAPKVGAAD